jgi:hypothetical protein
MPLQLTPITEGQVGTGPTLRDREVLGPRNTLRPAYRLREALDGVTLVMPFRWQQAADMWTMGMQTTGGALIRASGAVPLTSSGVDLWATVQADARMPGGQLWIAWGDQVPRSPGRDDFREGARLYYRPRALVAAVRGTALALA